MGLGGPGCESLWGPPCPPPLPPGWASSPPPPGAGTNQPRKLPQKRPPAPAASRSPLPHEPLPTWAGGGPGAGGTARASGARAPRSLERGGGGGGAFPSFLLLFLRRACWLQTDLLPLAPCPPLPGPAGLGSACDGERSGAGGSRAAALTASSAGRARGGGGGDSALRARGRPGRRGSGGSGSGAGAVAAAAAAPRLWHILSERDGRFPVGAGAGGRRGGGRERGRPEGRAVGVAPARRWTGGTWRTTREGKLKRAVGVVGDPEASSPATLGLSARPCPRPRPPRGAEAPKVAFGDGPLGRRCARACGHSRGHTEGTA